MRGVTLALLVLSAAAAGAQDLSPPPLLEPPPEATPPPVVESPPPQAVQPVPAPPAELAPPQAEVQPTFYDRCFAVPAVYVMPTPRVGVMVAATPGYGSAPPPNEMHGARPAQPSSSGVSGGGGVDARGALVIAVAVLVALPVVVWFFDSDAEPVVTQRFHCPTFSFEGYGGMSFVPGQGVSAPLFSGRVTGAYGYFGTDFQFDVTSAVGGFSTHALVRIAPKKHVEGALALGYRTMLFNGGYRDGFEVGLPHRYVFWRSGLNSFGLELRPMFLFGPRGVDAAIEATLVAPLFELLNARVGGRVFSYGAEVVWAFQAGLTFVW
jgi:hypothetical protein